MKSKKITIIVVVVTLMSAAGALLLARRPSSAPTETQTGAQSQSRPQNPSGDFPDHTKITTTVFWVGEPGDADNGNIPNKGSAWDAQWQAHYGGVDDPVHRSTYRPAGFTPSENPFYVALPYNDFDASGHRKATAGACQRLLVHPDEHYSYCKNVWLAVRNGDKTVYAQWEDVGPFIEDDPSYVFGNAAPRNTTGAGAGLDVSPAVRDYLGLNDVDKTSWQFVNPLDVPEGPWKTTITTSYGDSL